MQLSVKTTETVLCSFVGDSRASCM